MMNIIQWFYRTKENSHVNDQDSSRYDLYIHDTYIDTIDARSRVLKR